MKDFSSELLCRKVLLYTSADVVQHSFIVQKSISYLDLELCRDYIVWDGYTDSNYPSYSYSKEFVNNEEKCRKVLSESRSLLYTLHLDLPRGREGRLKSGHSRPENMNFHLTNPHIAKICIEKNFYSDILNSIIDYACECTDQNLKILKWFMKFDVLEKWVFRQLPLHIVNHIIECMHPELEDLEFVRECFRKLDLIGWVVCNDSLESDTVTDLLYQFHRIGRTVDLISTDDTSRNAHVIWTEEFIDFFASISSFELVDGILQFKSTPSFGVELHDFLCDDISFIRNSIILNGKAAAMSQQRQTLLLQVFWVYLKKSENNLAASEFLRLIWNSVPDSFISSDEFAAAFEEGFSSAEIDEVFHFYSEAVDGCPEFVEPRSLKQYCRTAIRRKLHERKNWLPEGIAKIGLPEMLQFYLNLGTEHFI